MHQKLYTTKAIILEGGERFPLVTNRDTGLPDGSATDYAIVNLRGKPINTSLRAMDSIALLLSWANALDINLEERLASFRLLSSNEISSLSEFLYRNFRVTESGINTKTVVGAHHRARMDAILEYFSWRSGKMISMMDKNDPSVANCNAKFKVFEKQMKKLRGSSTSRERGMLSLEQYARLIEIVTPGSPENPFQTQNQLRNYLIILAYGEFGIRRAEILTLKGRHLNTGAKAKVHVTFTPNDPHDPRTKAPSVKTKSRILPMDTHMARKFEELLRQRRSNPKTITGAKNTEFIMLSSHTGNPLSISAVDNMFVILRERFPDVFPPDFAPHHLRRTWNYRFSMMCKGKGISDDEANKLRKYGMGWSVQSKQPEKYNQLAIEQATAELLTAMQRQITG